MSDWDQIIDRTKAVALEAEEVSSEIIKAVYGQSLAARLFRVIPMSAKQRKLRVQDSIPSAYFVDGDTGLKRTTAMQWSKKILEAEEIAAIVTFPINVLDDSEYNLESEVVPGLAAAAAALIDTTVFFGHADRPTSWATPIVVRAGELGQEVIVASTEGQDFAGDVSDVMSIVEEMGHGVDGFAAALSVRGRLRNLRDSNGQPIYAPLTTGTNAGLLHGTDLIYANNGAWDATEALLVAGAFKENAVLGIRKDLTVEAFGTGVISDEDGKVIQNLLQQDMFALRMTMRVGFQTAEPLSQETGEKSYPFAVLRPAGYTGS